jgi:glutaredoxin 3
MVKEFLSQRGIVPEERDVSRNSSNAQELVRTTGQMGVPVTILNGQTVIGFDRGRLEQLLAQAPATTRPTFGASIADAGRVMSRQGSAFTPGAYVGRVRPLSIAERIGLVPGDIIVELNMKRIVNAGDLERALSSLSKGSRFSLVFLRGNKSMTTEGSF